MALIHTCREEADGGNHDGDAGAEAALPRPTMMEAAAREQAQLHRLSFCAGSCQGQRLIVLSPRQQAERAMVAAREQHRCKPRGPQYKERNALRFL